MYWVVSQTLINGSLNIQKIKFIVCKNLTIHSAGNSSGEGIIKSNIKNKVYSL